jgi:hypothetical protein
VEDHKAFSSEQVLDPKISQCGNPETLGIQGCIPFKGPGDGDHLRFEAIVGVVQNNTMGHSVLV